VRLQLEEKLGCDLSDRKKEIDAIIMADVEDQVNSHSEEEEASEDEAPAKKDESASEEEPEEDDKDDDFDPSAKKARKPKPSPKKRKAADDDGSDEDWGKKKKKAGGGKRGGGKSAFTKSFKLSPELADVVGSDVMPRHEVVKKLWAVIKERELQDPKNKQFAICDDQLLKVFGIKRFRTFGMMKHLKDHFVEPA